MIIKSEITGKTYKTVDECLADEKAYNQKKLEDERKKKEFEKKQEVAFQLVKESWKKYLDVLREGGYHVDALDEIMLLSEVLGTAE